MPDEPPKSIRKCSKIRCSCGDQLKFTWIRLCRAPREDPKAMAEHNCPFFLPQRSSKLSTSTTAVQNECELKSAPICSPRRQFGAKLCEYVPLELLRGSRLKLESLPVSVVVHEHLVRAGCMFFGTATRRTLTRLHVHRPIEKWIKLIPKTIGNRKRDCAWGGSGW